jgi:GntR family transcriptional regulator
MFTKVSPTDPRPPYVQVADDLRAAIDSGELSAGSKLPSGRDLATQYGVAPMTLQHALRVLRDEGRLTSWQGRGVYVSESGQPEDDATKLARRLDELTRDVEDLRQRVADLEGHRSTS